MRPLLRVLIVVTITGPLVLSGLEWSTTPWEFTRQFDLLLQTVQLSLFTIFLTLPVALSVGSVLFRSDGRIAAFTRWVLLIGVFIPLPVYACAWQPLLGDQPPWGRGLLFASSLHALAAFPGVVWIIGIGLLNSPRELEDDAAQILSPFGVWRRVTLPQLRSAIIAAIVWVVIQTSGEICITDMAMVRTFAEEIYTQFVAGTDGGLGRAVASSFPVLAVQLGVVAVWLRRGIHSRPLIFHQRMLTPATRFRRVLLLAILVFWAGLPLLQLFLQAAGQRPNLPPSWGVLTRELGRGLTLNADILGQSFLCSLLVAGSCLISVIILWEMSQDSQTWRTVFAFVLIALALAPGPIIGFGLLKAIQGLLDVEDYCLQPFLTARPLRWLLYDGDTPLPVMLAHIWRFLPHAALLTWPTLANIAKPLHEQAQQEGANGWLLFRRLTWPILRPSVCPILLVLMALALGELSASKIVQVPGQKTYIQELLNQMHYGVTSTVAAMAIVQLGLMVLIVAVLSLMRNRGNAPSA